MATVPTPVTPVIQVIDGKAVTTSLDLAAYFGKRHDTVLRKIATLDCSLDFTARNFAASTYTDPTGRECRCYLLTRDGFFFVAMGFTGCRAAEFKEAYIAAFSEMEARLALQLDNQWLQCTHDEAKRAFQRINAHWKSSLYPMLVSAKSPLAYELHDRFIDLAWLINELTYQSGEQCRLGGGRHG